MTTLTYNTGGQTASWTDPMKRKTTYTYTGTIGGSETTTETDARGDVTLWNYNNLELTSKTFGLRHARRRPRPPTSTTPTRSA